MYQNNIEYIYSKRRTGYMLSKSFFKICCVVILATAIFIPFKAWAGGGNPFVTHLYGTDDDSFMIFNYWDRRDRETFIQVTNEDDNEGHWVHVQIFNVPDRCAEFNFFDFYTPLDSHIYDMANLKANNEADLFPPAFDNGYGMVVVTIVTAPGGNILFNNDLIGNFRMIDDAGYEYRTNSPGLSREVNVKRYVFNFNDFAGANMSDVVGIACDFSTSGAGGSGGGVRCADPDSQNAIFEIEQFDENENEFSCQNTAFACFESDEIDDDFQASEDVLFGGFNLGLNDLYVNSRGEPSICNGFNPSGFIRASFRTGEGGETDADIFVGFTGLNNGNGTGSMDSWWIEDSNVND